MNKFFKNNYNLRRSLYTLAVIIISILFYRVTENMHVGNIFGTVINTLSPFIIGVVVAYILNCITNYIERRILVKFKVFRLNTPIIRKRKRKLAIFISFICFVGILVSIFAYIIPEMISSIENIASFIMKIDYASVHKGVNSFLIKNNLHVDPEIVNKLLLSFTGFFENLADSLKYIPDMISSVVEYSINFASSLVNIILGIMISVYILVDKEEVVAYGKKILKSLFSDVTCEKLTVYVKEINHSFNLFFTSKIVDSLIIGIIYYIISLIFGFPYPSLCALIIGITNMIPYFGPFIGAIPVLALTLLVDPITAIGVLISVIVLQQFDGLFLGPKILGESINLKPIGVIFAIIIGGAIAGPIGMFFGVPIFSVICKFAKLTIDNKYREKYGDEPKESQKSKTKRRVRTRRIDPKTKNSVKNEHIDENPNLSDDDITTYINNINKAKKVKNNSSDISNNKTKEE